ncbi:MAG: hypothetical protein AMJ60_08420 [Desulfobacterales bacterium SG8_35]|nr:MAG: hypothetical protein AMJ60_08420 [Desulfobacterales bacterium SG8_35]
MQFLSLLQLDKMKWRLVCNNIGVSRFFRLKEWPWRLILRGAAARKLSGSNEKVHLNKRCAFFLYGIGPHVFKA